MTRRRTLPPREAREYLDLLKGYGLPLEKCTIDIGPDGVKVSPPANSNAGETLDQYLNRVAPSPKTAENG